MKYIFCKTLAAIAGFCLIFGILCTVICTSATSKHFYYREYEKLGVAEQIGISKEELEQATNVLLDYTQGKREDMVVYARINGVNQPVFNEREIRHMADVKNLFFAAQLSGYIALGVGIVGLGLLALFQKDRRAVLKGFLLGNWVFLGVVAVIAVYAAIDFYSFWTNFHHVFFTNDLWLLNPATDNLILMVPEQFFFDLVFKIIAIFVAILIVLDVAAGMGIKALKKRVRHEV